MKLKKPAGLSCCVVQCTYCAVAVGSLFMCSANVNLRHDMAWHHLFHKLWSGAEGKKKEWGHLCVSLIHKIPKYNEKFVPNENRIKSNDQKICVESIVVMTRWGPGKIHQDVPFASLWLS